MYTHRHTHAHTHAYFHGESDSALSSLQQTVLSNIHVVKYCHVYIYNLYNTWGMRLINHPTNTFCNNLGMLYLYLQLLIFSGWWSFRRVKSEIMATAFSNRPFSPAFRYSFSVKIHLKPQTNLYRQTQEINLPKKIFQRITDFAKRFSVGESREKNLFSPFAASDGFNNENFCKWPSRTPWPPGNVHNIS